MNIKIGCHLSVSGGYENMGKTALSIGADTFQFFTRNPRGGSFKAPSDEDIAKLNALMAEHSFAPIIAHAPYTLNPCAADDAIRAYTKDTMAADLKILDSMPNALYNFHPGCHVSQGVEVGIEKTADTLNDILKRSSRTVVLIETMAGKGSEIGKTFEEVRAIIDRVEDSSRVGVCLDTCHVHDAGYDISSDPYGVLDEFNRVIGLYRLRAVHLNDSKNPLGAHKDRHEKIGDGYLTLDGIIKIVSHPIISKLPICLETPNELDGYAREIALIRDAIKNL